MKRKLFTQFFTSFFISLTLLPSISISSEEVNPVDVLRHYVVVAHAKYEDALSNAQELDQAINNLIAFPSAKSLNEARLKWIKARIPYQQSEVYLFGNLVINIWKDKINAWPLDEGLLDYVDSSYGKKHEDNPLYASNIIANSKIFINGKEIDASSISTALLRRLHEAGETKTNVSTGYHAIEFLLWGQDLNTSIRGAGNRPYTDYDVNHCTGGNCRRRSAYLKTASQLLIHDLEEIVKAWSPDGEATKTIMQNTQSGLNAIIAGIRSFSYAELAGERMNLGLILHDPEQEIDCFSDNTHASHLNNIIGIISAYTGEYTRNQGENIHGPSLSDLVRQKSKELDTEIKIKLFNTLKDAQILAERAEHVESYDQMISKNNIEGNKMVQKIINDLIDQEESFKKMRTILDLENIS
ncbi:imelysin family protein [Candidatus Liberibacter sp.]|uniref:imelysin family protein n=1 Tax=Candidatus Liberibacter sp. TaxID=34022 RepID=UPI0015F5E514|nr:imelysin family protein [Candidatus Liberibacter sp.]MBA5723706.1 peptidase [Candidatus Liberibacter sp.]